LPGDARTRCSPGGERGARTHQPRATSDRYRPGYWWPRKRLGWCV